MLKKTGMKPFPHYNKQQFISQNLLWTDENTGTGYIHILKREIIKLKNFT
jgi:hypothetical protein